MSSLTYTIEERDAKRVLIWNNGASRPANEIEVALCDSLVADAKERKAKGKPVKGFACECGMCGGGPAGSSCKDLGQRLSEVRRLIRQ